MPRASFQVRVPADPARQNVVIVGTDRALGDWQPAKGLVLQRQDDGAYEGAVDLPYGLVEFKITRGSWATEETYKDGTPCLNYQYLIAHDLHISAEVENWKDGEPWDADRIHGRAIECELDATQLGTSRRVCIWLPPGYVSSRDSRHPVLYLLDGQDTLQTRAALGEETIAADVWVRNLTASRQIEELILVAVFHREDFGQRDIELSPQIDGPKTADFLVNDLKPFVDYTICRDRTLADPANTGVLGFSLGGSLALWMALRHYQTFGKFACLSTAYEDLSGDPPEACSLIEHIRVEPSFRPNRRLYFDHGTLCGDTTDEMYQRRMTEVLREKKFVEGKDFKVLIAEGTDHSLSAWRARLGAPLMFLFGK
jgi:enterochelin esterase-like enzyme